MGSTVGDSAVSRDDTKCNFSQLSSSSSSSAAVNNNNNSSASAAAAAACVLSSAIGNRTAAAATAKKIVIKNFRAKPRLSEDFQSDTWRKLEESVVSIHQQRPVNYSLEQLYQAVQNLCTGTGVPARLYDQLKELIDCQSRREVAQLVADDNCDDSVTYLRRVSHYWHSYCQQIVMIRSIFLYMDRTYVLQNPLLPSVWDLGLELFRLNVATAPVVQRRVVSGVLELIERERAGDAVDRTLVRSLLRMLSELGIYETVFEDRFLSATERLYSSERLRLCDQLTVPAYLLHVQRRLGEEEQRLQLYLEPSTRRPLLACVERQLLAEQLQQLLDRGMEQLLRPASSEQLSLLYQLVLKIKNGPAQLLASFNTLIKKQGGTIVVDKQKDRSMIQDLLDYKDELDRIVSRCFQGNEKFAQSVREAFENFINQRQNKPAEFIAKYLDNKLRVGNKECSEVELESLMDKVIVLFRFIHGKDVFEAFYKKDLAKRLLLGKSASVDAEKLMLSKLKQECGAGFTSKLEGMFKDMEISKDIMTAFKQHMSNPSDPTLAALGAQFDLNVNVLTMGYWPSYPVIEVTLPPSVQQLQHHFATFYLAKHSGRKLHWQPSLGYCLLRATFNCGVKELQVSLYQALVLLLFNSSTEYPLQQIQALTEIEAEELNRTLQSLACGRARVIQKVPRGKDVQPGDRFVFNNDFSHQLYRIKINQIQLKETSDEHKKTEERVFQDRQYQIDAAIVRIMKMRKSLAHSLLISELYQQLNGHFHVEPVELKKRVESLIDRDYMERDKDDTNKYRYVA